MPVYKLSYFKAKGRAEVTRMLFTLAGQEFEDIRLEGESWQKFKPSNVSDISWVFLAHSQIQHNACILLNCDNYFKKVPFLIVVPAC